MQTSVNEPIASKCQTDLRYWKPNWLYAALFEQFVIATQESARA